MIRTQLVAAVTGAALVAGGIALAAPTAAVAPLTSISAGHTLHAGQVLTSTDRRHQALLVGNRLVVRTASGRTVWRSGAGPSGATLRVARTGQLLLVSQRTRGWQADTSSAGSSARLTLRGSTLTLTQGGALIWSSAIGNGCAGARGRTVRIDISSQWARACRGSQQLRAFRVTTGAARLGYDTPTGTRHVQAKVRDTVLHPAAGGAYPVHYWVPYDGPYGIHDSPWQAFPYGSAAYRTRGSHGCTHVPGATMAWLYRWIRVGSTVQVAH